MLIGEGFEEQNPEINESEESDQEDEQDESSEEGEDEDDQDEEETTEKDMFLGETRRDVSGRHDGTQADDGSKRFMPPIRAMGSTTDLEGGDISQNIDKYAVNRIRRSLLSTSPYIVPPPLPLVIVTPRSQAILSPRTGADLDLPRLELNEPESAKKMLKPEPLYPPWCSLRLGDYFMKAEASQYMDTATNFDASTSNTKIASTVALMPPVDQQISSAAVSVPPSVPTREKVKSFLVYRNKDPFEILSSTSEGKFVDLPKNAPTDSLQFDSGFECGNLCTAHRVIGRGQPQEFSPSKGADMLDNTGSLPPRVLPTLVHQEYALTCKKDTFTNGHIQWYFFSVANASDQAGLRVRFRITNMMKKDSLYNYGMKPVVFSKCALESKGNGWTHEGEDIAYYKGWKAYKTEHGKKERSRFYYTFTFVYEFKYPGDTVYFSHCYPYSYTDLQKDLKGIMEEERCRMFLRRKELCTTLAGNICDLITITNHTEDPEILSKRPGIVFTARTHPGESNSSFIMKGILNYLTSDTPEANVLRDHFVFKIVPMINVDGTINGNYRSSLAGCDLNRRYLDPSPDLHPVVCAVKELLRETHRHRGVLFYVDIHGHSRKKNIFLYGCDQDTKFVDEKIFPRILPHLLSTCSGYFDFKDCTFGIQKSKRSTGRVVAFSELGIPNSYTLEASFCGNGLNKEQKVLRALNKRAWKSGKSGGETLGEAEQDITQTGNRGRVSPEERALVDSFQQHRHFTREDLESAGSKLVESLLTYCNLHKAALSKTSYKYIAGHQHGGNNDQYEADIDEGPEECDGSETSEPRPFIGAVWPEEYEPFIKPAVLQAEAAKKFASSWSRAKAEVDLREKFQRKKRDPGPDHLNGQADGTLVEDPELEEICSEDENNESLGSDSDPSADNLPLSVLMKTRAWAQARFRIPTYKGMERFMTSSSRRRLKGKKKRRKKKGLTRKDIISPGVSSSFKGIILQKQRSIPTGKADPDRSGEQQLKVLPFLVDKEEDSLAATAARTASSAQKPAVDEDKRKEETLDPLSLKLDNERMPFPSKKRMGPTFMEPTLSRLRAVNSVNLDKQTWRQDGRHVGRSPQFPGYLTKKKVRPALEPQETLEDPDSETQEHPQKGSNQDSIDEASSRGNSFDDLFQKGSGFNTNWSAANSQYLPLSKNGMNPAFHLREPGDIPQVKNVEPPYDKIPKRMVTHQLDLGPLKSPILLPNQRSRYPIIKNRSIRIADFLDANNGSNRYLL